MAKTEPKKTKSALPTDPVERFRIVANRRVNKAIAAIKSMNTFAKQRGDKPGKYMYTAEDVERIANALTNANADLDKTLTNALAGKSKTESNVVDLFANDKAGE